jgi:hypothetical protein
MLPQSPLYFASRFRNAIAAWWSSSKSDPKYALSWLLPQQP